MITTSHSLIQNFFSKDPSGTSSHVIAVAFSVTTFMFHVGQSYLSTPVANVKNVPVLLPAQSPIPATPTTTRPLTPTRSTNFVDASADVSYVSFGLVLVLIGVLVGASSTYMRTKSGNVFIPHDSPRERDQDQNQDQDQDLPDEPPTSPPQQDEEPCENAEDCQDSTGEERDDDAGDPDDESGKETNGEEGNGDINASVSDGSPGGDPDDPSGSSYLDDIPPPHFEPDPWDILALTLLYIFAAATIMQYALRKRFVLNALGNCLRISAISIKVAAGGYIERALQQVDDGSFWIIGRRVLVGMNNANVGLHNGAHKLRNIMASVVPKLNMTDELREAKPKPTLIEGLLVPVSSQLSIIGYEVRPKPTLIEGLLAPISSQLSQIPSFVSLQVLELPEPIVEALPLPLPIPESATTPLAEPFLIKTDTSSTEAESDFLRIVRAISGWGTVVLLIRRVVREWRQRRSRVVQPQPQDEIEDEDKNKDEGSTTLEAHSDSNVTSDILDGHEDQTGKSEHVNDVLDSSFVTAQEISGIVSMTNPSYGDHPVPPMISVSPSSSVPSTPEPATTHPSGTLSFAGVLTSSTLRSTRAKEDESRPAPPPIITLSTPTTPEPATPYPSGTPSFSDVLTSSTFRSAHTQKAKSESSPEPCFIQSTIPAPDLKNTPSFADIAAPFAFTFQSPRRTNTIGDTVFMITSRVPTMQSLSLHDASFSLSPVLLRKRRRLDEAGKGTICLATPWSNGISTSSPAGGHNRRWPHDEVGTPTRNMHTSTYTSSTPGSKLSSKGHHLNTQDEFEFEFESELEQTTDIANVFNTTSLSFNNVFCSPALRRSRRRNVEETKETSVDRKLFSQSFSSATDKESDLTGEVDSEVEGQPKVGREGVERKNVSGVETEKVGEEEQTHEGEDNTKEKDMDIEEEDCSVVHDIETEVEQDELTPRPTPASTSIGNSLTSEGDQTVLDPKIIAQGAAEMLRAMQEEMEREKAAKEKAARERRAGKMKMRESRESSKVRGDEIHQARRKYVGPLEALKREERVQVELTQGSSFSAANVHHTPWQSPQSQKIQETTRMRALVVKAYASQRYDDEEIDKLTLWHLGFGNMEG